MESPFPNRPQRYVPAASAARCIDHVTITAANPQGDAEWYRDTLGHRFMEYTVIPDRPDFPVFCMTTVCERSHDLGIVWDPTPVRGRINHFAYFVDSSDDLLARRRRAAQPGRRDRVRSRQARDGRAGLPVRPRPERHARRDQRRRLPELRARLGDGPLRAPAGLERVLQEPRDAAFDVRVVPARCRRRRRADDREAQRRRPACSSDERRRDSEPDAPTRRQGVAARAARARRHPLDGLDPDAARGRSTR